MPSGRQLTSKLCPTCHEVFEVPESLDHQIYCGRNCQEQAKRDREKLRDRKTEKCREANRRHAREWRKRNPGENAARVRAWRARKRAEAESPEPQLVELFGVHSSDMNNVE